MNHILPDVYLFTCIPIMALSYTVTHDITYHIQDTLRVYVAVIKLTVISVIRTSHLTVVPYDGRSL